MKKIITFLLFISFSLPVSALSNQLKGHSSPYLAMHGDDPVAWQEWNQKTIARAQTEHKLLFVSSGYFSCHWCHVMQRESYRNPEIAQLLNKYFIPVKVDRELHASLDSRLIDFVEKTRGYAGWPLNVFITPKGHPLVGIVYLPADDFKGLLKSMIAEWQQRATELEGIAAQASIELAGTTKLSETPLTKNFTELLQDKFLNQTFSQADEMQGGFGEQNKFPLVPQLDALLNIYQQKKDKKLGDFLKLTLNNMASQGLRDQLGGGFYRYSVDPGWQIPHFEKMLYDNALLASLYLKAATIFHSDDYRQVGLETLDFILDEMSDGSGAFFASISAIDNNNVEGGYYLWDKKQLEKLLTEDEMKVVEITWQLKGPEDIEGGHHLVMSGPVDDVAKSLNRPVSEIKQFFNSARNKMLQARKLRTVPVDKKKIASWNGLVLSALVAGARADNKNRKYQHAAEKLQAYIHNHFWVKQKLNRAVSEQSFGEAGLEDAAYLAKGLLDWASYTGLQKDYLAVSELIAASWNWFYTDKGWQLNQQPLLKYKEFSLAILDGPMPSPSAVLTESSLLLDDKVKDTRFMIKAEQHLKNVGELVSESVFWNSSYLRAYQLKVNN